MGANMLGAPLALGFLAMDGIGGLKCAGGARTGAQTRLARPLAAGPGVPAAPLAPTPPPPPSPSLRPRGWQWLFLLEGLPAVVLGGAVLLFLPPSLDAARFLSPEERAAVAEAVARDHVAGRSPEDSPARSARGAARLLRLALANRYLWVVWSAGLLMTIAVATFISFTPILLQNLLAGTAFSGKATVQAPKGSRDLRPVGLAAVPFGLATIFSYLVALSSERFNELFWHIIACLTFGAAAMAAFVPLAGVSVPASFAAMALSLAVAFAANGPGMVLVARLCRVCGRRRREGCPAASALRPQALARARKLRAARRPPHPATPSPLNPAASQGEEQVVAQPISNGFNILGGVIGPFITAALLHTDVRAGRGGGRGGGRAAAAQESDARRARTPASPLLCTRTRVSRSAFPLLHCPTSRPASCGSPSSWASPCSRPPS
jgi:hypothetical protein